MKLSAQTARITRSPIPERGQVIVMSGEQFEDGKQRIVVGYDVSPENVVKLTDALVAREAADERMQAAIDAINALMHQPSEL